MRIVSLLPAATEWVCALGAEADLVGRSHECDDPPSVQHLPVLTQPAFPVEGDSAAIEARVQARLQQGLSLYDIDIEQLRALEPDLVLTQAQCEVCAVSLPHLEAALGAWTGAKPHLFSMEPQTLKQVLGTALRLGKTLGRVEAAIQWIGEAEQHLQALRNRLGLHKRSDTSRWPTVACIEWMEPLMIAGHWMPDVVEMAGGRAVLAEKGTRSRTVAWDELRAADPDVIAVLPCGFTLEQTRRDLHFLTDRAGWVALKAVRQGRVYLFDGNAYFNRPGPRLYRSIELLAAALYPEEMSDFVVEDWETNVLSLRNDKRNSDK